MNPPSHLPGLRPPVLFLAAVFIASTASAQMVAVESDVVVTGALGLSRRVDSETLILSGASQVVRRQESRERQAEERETRRMAAETLQQMQEDRKEAEKDSLQEAGAPTPLNAGAVEASMAEGTGSAFENGASSAEGTSAGGESSAASSEAAPSSVDQTESQP